MATIKVTLRNIGIIKQLFILMSSSSSIGGPLNIYSTFDEYVNVVVKYYDIQSIVIYFHSGYPNMRKGFFCFKTVLLFAHK